MAVYSMTGYASAQLDASTQGSDSEVRTPAARQLGLEIRSVNSRFLDLSFRLPDELRAMEPVLRTLLTKKIKRGKVEVRAAIENAGAGTLPELSTRFLQRLNGLQDNVQAWLPDARALSVADVLRLSANTQSGQEDWNKIVPTLAEKALKALLAARKQEGERLATMLHSHLNQLRVLTLQAVPLVPQLVEQQRQRFMERAGKRPWAWPKAAPPPKPRKTAPCPRPPPLPFASMWPKKSRACNRTWTRSSACCNKAARSANAWIF